MSDGGFPPRQHAQAGNPPQIDCKMRVIDFITSAVGDSPETRSRLEGEAMDALRVLVDTHDLNPRQAHRISHRRMQKLWASIASEHGNHVYSTPIYTNSMSMVQAEAAAAMGIFSSAETVVR